MMNHHTDDGWFLDFDNRRWREYPNLLIDGTAKEFNERLDTLALGDGGYTKIQQEINKLTKAKVSAECVIPSPSASVGGVSLSSPAAPEVEESTSQSSPPSGVPKPDATYHGVAIYNIADLGAEGLHNVIAKAVGEPTTIIKDGIKRRKGL